MGVAKGALFGERSYMYPLSMFWVKYYEKLSKGYIDNSDVYLTPDATTRKPEKPEETCEKQAESASARLFAILQRFSKTALVGSACQRADHPCNPQKIGITDRENADGEDHGRIQ